MPSHALIRALRLVCERMGDTATMEICDAALGRTRNPRISRADAIEQVDECLASIYEAWWSGGVAVSA